MKPWRLIAMFLIGVSIGAPTGAWFYVTFLQTPTTVVNNQNDIKQKIKGRGNSADQAIEESQDIEVNHNRGKRKRK